MKHKTLLWILLPGLLAGLLLAPLSAVARLVGGEVPLVRLSFHEAMTGGATVTTSGNKFGIAWLEKSFADPYNQPFVGWLDLDGSTVSRHQLDSKLSDSSAPDVLCGAFQLHCLATWVMNDKVYARWVESDGTMGSIWRVDTGQSADSSTLTSAGDYLIIWQKDDGGIAMREVDVSTGPFGDVVSVQKPAGCSELQNARVTYNYMHNIYGIAFECYDTVHLEARSHDGLTYLWSRNLTSFAPLEYTPDVAVGDSGKFLLVFGTQSPFQGIYGQRFDANGNAVGSPFVIDPDSNARGPRLEFDYATGEYLVTYTRSEVVYAMRVKDSDNALMGAPFAVSPATGGQYSPAVSRNRADVSRSLIIWTDGRAGQDDDDVYGRWIELEPILGAGDPLSYELPGGGSRYYQASAKANQWQAVGIRPSINGDLDLYLADSPDYGNVLVSSLNGTGQADVVVMNGYQSGLAAYFPYVQHFSGDTFYSIEYAPRAAKITEDDNWSNQDLEAESVARMFDVYALAGQPLNIQVAPDVSDLAMALFDANSGVYQALANAVVQADTGGAGQYESLTYVPAHDGWYGLLVWKKDDSADSFSLLASGAGDPPIYTIFLPLVEHNY